MSKRILPFAVLLALSACGSDHSGTFETDEGEKGTYSVTHQGDESQVSIKTDEGEVKVRSGASASMPAGYSLYPGASVITNTTLNSGKGTGSMVLLESQDSPEKLLAFYRQQAEAHGIAIKMEMKTAQGSMISGEDGKGHAFSFQANAAESGTSGQLMVSEETEK